MPWLTVLGDATWSPSPDLTFEPGQYEVDEEVARYVRESGIPRLVLSDEPPALANEDEEPLGREALGVPYAPGLQLAPDVPPPAAKLQGGTREHRCDGGCGGVFESPSRGALLRHVELHHRVNS